MSIADPFDGTSPAPLAGEVPAPGLDPVNPGHWLAALGLAWFGVRGHWAPVAVGATNWQFEVTAGDLPTVAEVALTLEQASIEALAADPDRARWFNHAGNSNITGTIKKVLKALRAADPDEVISLDPDAHWGPAGKGWMIDESWRIPPGSMLSRSPDIKDGVTPLHLVALALFGAAHPALPEISMWQRKTFAVGWVWPADAWQPVAGRIPGPPRIQFAGRPGLDSTIATWRRISRPSEPHSGALGEGQVVTLTPPTWEMHVSRELGHPPVLGETAARLMEREAGEVPGMIDIAGIARACRVKRRTVDQWLQRDLLPPPRWRHGRASLWPIGEIAAWARLSDREFHPPQRPRPARPGEGRDRGGPRPGPAALRVGLGRERLDAARPPGDRG